MIRSWCHKAVEPSRGVKSDDFVDLRNVTDRAKSPTGGGSLGSWAVFAGSDTPAGDPIALKR